MPPRSRPPDRTARAQGALWDWRPERSARGLHRTWSRLLPRQRVFRNPTARLLAEFADAIQSEAGWEAWAAAHPDAADVLPIEPEPGR
jgi:hypothetical protein